MSWTDEKIARLKEMWGRGESAAVIAERIGLSRNAVIGKVRRLGLPYRLTTTCAPRGNARPAGLPAPRRPAGTAKKQPREVMRHAVPHTSRKPKPKPQPAPAATKPKPGWNVPRGFRPPEAPPPMSALPILRETCQPWAIPFADLREEHCRWPVGDPKAEGFGFCGAPRHFGRYCERHDARAHRAA